MCWVPAFYYRINDARNLTYAGATPTNSVDVQSYVVRSPDVPRHAAAGMRCNRAVLRCSGSIQPGFFIDKYQCSNNGGMASSIKTHSPLSTHSTDHNPISALTAAARRPTTVAVSRRRTASGSSLSRHALPVRRPGSTRALAHGQAATSNAWCAWYDAAGTTNFRAAAISNALNDGNDSTVVYQSDSYASNCGTTGSAHDFARTTHSSR